MKIVAWAPWLVLLVAPAPLAAQTDEAATADLARLIQKGIVARMPPVYENAADWGRTVPLPDRMLLPRLRRAVVEVGDHLEVPDGTWRKFRLSVEDPDRDIRVRVPSFRRVGLMKYRVVIEADVALRGEGDVRQWRNGLELADLTGRADALLNVRAECDVSGRFEAGKGLAMNTELADLNLNLKEFTPKQVTLRRAGLTVRGDALEATGEELRDSLQALLRAVEPGVRMRANDALARGMQGGKDPVAAAELIKAVAPLLGR